MGVWPEIHKHTEAPEDMGESSSAAPGLFPFKSGSLVTKTLTSPARLASLQAPRMQLASLPST